MLSVRSRKSRMKVKFYAGTARTVCYSTLEVYVLGNETVGRHEIIQNYVTWAV